MFQLSAKQANISSAYLYQKIYIYIFLRHGETFFLLNICAKWAYTHFDDKICFQTKNNHIKNFIDKP